MQMTLETIRERPLTHIVSLGPVCSTSLNLRRHFDFDTAYPFDWWYTPEPGLAAFLRDPDIDRLYDPFELERIETPPTVRHRTLGIYLHHEFPRRWDQPEEPVVEGFLDHLDAPRKRTRYLLDRWRRLDAPRERLLLVREDLAGPDIEAALQATLRHADWCLVSVAGPPMEPAHGWRRDPASWDAVLDALGVDLDRTRHRPFRDQGAPIERALGHV